VAADPATEPTDLGCKSPIDLQRNADQHTHTHTRQNAQMHSGPATAACIVHDQLFVQSEPKILSLADSVKIYYRDK